jgi:hypothetical protein
VEVGILRAEGLDMSTRWFRLGALLLFTGISVVGAGCSTATEEEGDALGTGEDDIVTNNVATALAYGKSLVGTKYGWWTGGQLQPGAPMWTASGAAPSAATVKGQSVNCSGLMNLLLRKVGRAPRGGTGAYGTDYVKVQKAFDPDRRYPAGTLLGRRYRDPYKDQGHVAVVLENGNVLQSSANGGPPSSSPGVTITGTPTQFGRNFYEYAVLPQDWLGGGGGGGGGGAGDGDGDREICAPGDGFYCGQNGVPGKSTTLYRCAGGKVSLSKECENGCVKEPVGTHDHCRADDGGGACQLGDGKYCGKNGVPGDPDALYTCRDGKPVLDQKCANGCVAEKPGIHDHCK